MVNVKDLAMVVVISVGCAALTQVSVRADSGTTSIRAKMIGRLVVVPVGLGNAGVYSFLLDTGTDTSVIDSSLAAELGLAVTGRTTLMTTSGSTPAGQATATVVFGAIRAENIEVLTAPLDALAVVDRDVRGVLGQDILRRSSWLVDYRRGVIDQGVDGSASRAGARLPLQWSAGRPTVAAVFDDDEPVNLVLDSAANGLVLFAPRATLAARGSMRMRSLEVEAEVPMVAADTLRVGPVLFEHPRAGLVIRSDFEPGESGLLPTSMFEAIYFDTARNEVVVVPRR
jgi:predicted aspartyl protease